MNKAFDKAFDDLLYDSGLIADGCWDELGTYEQEAIERLIQLTVLKCADIAMREDHDPAECIKKHFGVE
jgi:hypothetical protein